MNESVHARSGHAQPIETSWEIYGRRIEKLEQSIGTGGEIREAFPVKQICRGLQNVSRVRDPTELDAVSRAILGANAERPRRALPDRGRYARAPKANPRSSD